MNSRKFLRQQASAPGKTRRRTVTWRRGTKGRLSARLAAVRARIADGPTQRIRDTGNQHMPGKEAWLIGERRVTGPCGCAQEGMQHRAGVIRVKCYAQGATTQLWGGSSNPARGAIMP